MKVEFIKGVVEEVDWIFYFMSLLGGGGRKYVGLINGLIYVSESVCISSELSGKE